MCGRYSLDAGIEVSRVRRLPDRLVVIALEVPTGQIIFVISFGRGFDN